MPRDLSKRPTLLRATPARGLAKDHVIDRDGGDFEAGLITGVAVVTRGEALGHDLWLDDEFIAQVGKALRKAGKMGVKSRFTHPGLSSDGLGKSLGRLKASDFPEQAGMVRGDLHFSQAAHKTPQGDLAGYVMDMADEDPSSFGKSIVFERDVEAEEAFMRKNGGEGDDDDYWSALRGFASPDADNERGLRHARLKRLRASDVVDSPAANPGGMFHRGDEIALEAAELIEFALGLSEEMPVMADEIGLDIHPDRVRSFVVKFLNDRGLELKQKESEMSVNSEANSSTQAGEQGAGTTAPANPPNGGTTEAGAKPADTAAGTSTKPAEAPKPEEQASAENPGKKFLDAFGDQGGVWFAQGKTFEQAQQLHTEKLQKENEELKKRLGSIAGGKEEPFSFGVAADDKAGNKPASKDQERLQSVLGEGLGTFAANLRFRGRQKT